ncbi:MAG: acyltransferase [Candidatus Margulisiibacteriota bacterium]|jgi:acetyltransferase-like isoleucine patch superfamily enzyme
MIAKTAIIYKNVIFGKNVIIEDFCVIGVPFKNYENEPTIIGDNAIIRSHTIIYAGNKIGDDFQTGNKANIRELNQIGNNVSIGTLSVIEHHILIEDDVRLHTQVFVPEYSQLKKGCWLGPNVVLTNAAYPLSPTVKEDLNGVIVEEKAKIGANSTILPGVIIGKNSLIGAGSVVTKNCKENGIYLGNPAKFQRALHY